MAEPNNITLDESSDTKNRWMHLYAARPTGTSHLLGAHQVMGEDGEARESLTVMWLGLTDPATVAKFAAQSAFESKTSASYSGKVFAGGRIHKSEGPEWLRITRIENIQLMQLRWTVAPVHALIRGPQEAESEQCMIWARLHDVSEAAVTDGSGEEVAESVGVYMKLGRLKQTRALLERLIQQSHVGRLAYEEVRHALDVLINHIESPRFLSR